MIKKIVEIEAKVDKAVEGVEKVSKKVDELKDKSVEATDKLSDGVEQIGKSSKKSAKGINKLAKGFKGVGVAMKAAGIGLIIGLLATLKEVFMSNQKVADAFAVAFETISLIFNELTNAIIDVYEGVAISTDKFDSLKKVLMGLLTLVLTPTRLSFYGIKLALQQAQLIWEESFFGSGDEETIKKLNENIAETKQSLKDTALEAYNAGKDIVTNIVAAGEEIGKFASDTVEKVGEIYDSAKSNVELQKAAEKAAVANQGLIEQYDRQAEQLRQLRDDDTKSIDDRIEANDKLKLKLEEQKEKMLENAKAILAAAQAQFDKNDNDENAIALQQAKNELAGVEAQITGFMSEQMSNDIALKKEKLDLTLSQQEASTTLSIEQKRFNAEQIEDDLARLEALRLVLEEEKIIELERLQTKIDSYAADTQARADAEAEYAAKKQEIDQAIISSDNEVQAQKKKNDEDDALRKKTLREQEIAALGATLGQIGNILGKESKAGKAFAVASALINTYQGITAGVALGYPQAIPAVIAAAATGFKAVKDIMQTKPKETATPSQPQVSTGGTTAIPRMPSFNIVGGSTGNQIAEIGKTPQKAFVVSGEVTTAQQLERNAVSEASI